ncbi:MAG: nitrous oxide reductase accessory protein NosL, partial [Candidatus Latescibacteria bacterium]|nr:nitrous oxide reductase accessory protein NosL [Candidatus Latescibacterota bacterium]
MKRRVNASPLLFVFIVACQGVDLKPVNIMAEDMCAFCRMAISETRYAAEFIDADGMPFKFDDLGCLRHYLQARQKQQDIAAFFAVNVETREWMPAEQAYYVRSVEFKTPMRGGIV